MAAAFRSAGLWLEDCRPGRPLALPEVDCSEARLLGHAALFDAYHPLNTDRAYASRTRFGRPVAHGPFPLACCLAALGDLAGPALVAMARLSDWLFLGPAPMDARLQAAATVLRVAPGRGQGSVDLEIRLTNAAGELVQRGEVTFVLRRRPAQSTADPTTDPASDPAAEESPRG